MAAPLLPAGAPPPVAPPGKEAEPETIFKVMSNQVRDSQLYTA
jgi:hypothetical protein